MSAHLLNSLCAQSTLGILEHRWNTETQNHHSALQPKGQKQKKKKIKLSPLLSGDNQNPQNMSGASHALPFLVLTRLIPTHPVSPLSSPSSGSPPWNYTAFLYYKAQITYASLHIHITIRMLLFKSEIILLMPIYPAKR